MKEIDVGIIEASFFKRGNPLKKILKISLDLFNARQTGILYGTNDTQGKFLPTSMWDRGIMDRFDGRGLIGWILKLFGKTIVTWKKLSPVYFFKTDETGGKKENDGVISFVLRNCAQYYSKGISVLICPEMGRHLNENGEQYVYIPFYSYDGTQIKKPDQEIKTDTNIVKQFKASNSIYIYLPAYGILVINTADPYLVRMAEGRFENETELKRRLDILIQLVEASSLGYLGQLKGKRGAELLWRKERHLRETSTELIENEQKYRDLYENAPAAYFSMDQDGVIFQCNRNAEYLSGYSRTELIGKSVISMFVNKMEMIQIPNYIRQHINNGQAIKDMEIQMRQKDGSVIWVNLSIDAIREKTEAVTEFRVVALNITPRKNLEKKLMQAQKMEAIGTLAGGIAHDFNNILSPISGYTEMLLMDANGNIRMMEDLSIILDCTKHAKNLVSKLLTFSKQKDLEFKPIRINQSIKEAMVLARSFLPATIKIKQQIEEDCGYIMADPVQLHQVVMNLLANAFHAMEDEGGTLEISMQRIIFQGNEKGHLVDGKPYVKIQVSDSGPGIQQEFLEHIFDPYFTTKPDGKGTGLGLSVVHGIVNSHGGQIEVESQQGEGTVFTICLPVYEGSVDIEEQIKVDLAVKTGNERILLVDDDHKVAVMQTQMLEKLGYQVTCHEDSLTALKEFEHNPKGFDLIVTDMTMPELTGYQLAEKIFEINPSMPVILCTGYDDSIEKIRLNQHNIVELVNKPLGIKAFSTILRKVLDHQQAA